MYPSPGQGGVRLVPNGISDVDLVADTDEAQITIGAQQRRLLDNLAEIDRRALWKNSGARDMAGWVSARYGVSPYRAKRMVNAGYALESLPRTAKALETGRLNLDRVVELVRLATPESEDDLVKWARRVTPQWIAQKADGAERQRTRENRTKDGARYFDWWWGPDATLRFEGLLPNDAGMKFARAIECLAEEMPISPDPKDETTLSQRHADALVAMATDSTGSGDRGRGHGGGVRPHRCAPRKEPRRRARGWVDHPCRRGAASSVRREDRTCVPRLRRQGVSHRRRDVQGATAHPTSGDAARRATLYVFR